MSDHNRYCLLNNMFAYSFEENSSEMIDNDDTIKSTELLIDCVRSYPHLYNHQDKNYKDHLMKENSWKEIATVMKMSGKINKINTINWNNQ